MRALEFITCHVIYNPAYTYKFQLKTTIYTLHIILTLSEPFSRVHAVRSVKVYIYCVLTRDLSLVLTDSFKLASLRNKENLKKNPSSQTGNQKHWHFLRKMGKPDKNAKKFYLIRAVHK